MGSSHDAIRGGFRQRHGSATVMTWRCAFEAIRSNRVCASFAVALERSSASAGPSLPAL